MIVSLTQPYSSEKLQAQQALYSVIDPELLVNVIDLGLIYDITFGEEDTIAVTMTLTTSYCPMGEAITNNVRNALEQTFPEKKVEINLTFDPPWSFERITEEGKAQLGA